MKAVIPIILLSSIAAQTTVPTPYDPSANKTPIVLPPNPAPSGSTSSQGPNTPLMPSSTTPNVPLMPSSTSSNKNSTSSGSTTSKSSDAKQLGAFGSLSALAIILSAFL